MKRRSWTTIVSSVVVVSLVACGEVQSQVGAADSGDGPAEDVPFSTRGWRTDFSKHAVPLDEILSGGPPKDGIPAIDDPKFVRVSGSLTPRIPCSFAPLFPSSLAPRSIIPNTLPRSGDPNFPDQRIMSVRRVCVYCASSTKVDSVYLDAAERLGRILARNAMSVVYGAGGTGSMGRLAEGALAEGGEVIGVIPRFMQQLEWYHRGLSELQLVDDLHERKRKLIEGADAVVALPGGSGTLDELIEAISLKRLGSYLGPIVMVNTRGFFDPCIELLERCIEERFMDERHRSMWQVVGEPEGVPEAFRVAPGWSSDAIQFAAI